MDKSELRLAMQDRRARLNAEETSELGSKIAHNLLKRPELTGIPKIGIYSAIRGEVPTEPLFSLLRRQASLHYPRINPGRELEFAPIDDFKQLCRGFSGILEPDVSIPATPLEQLGLLVIPGLAFDLAGNRIGWGQGFYDRILRNYQGLRFALAYDFQVLDQIPANADDEKMDLIITEARAIGGRASAG